MVKSFVVARTSRLRSSIVLYIAKILTPSLYRSLFQAYARGMIPFILEDYGHSPLVGAEVGVFRGTNAERILSVLNIKKLFLIDPYLPYVDGNGAVWDTSNKDLFLAQERLGRFKQCQFIRKTSIDALNDVPENLDFVYIDANHKYEAVKADIEAYYPKVRLGGVLGGHDFCVDHQGVIFAVVDFARRIEAKLYVEYADWWIVKEG